METTKEQDKLIIKKIYETMARLLGNQYNVDISYKLHFCDEMKALETPNSQ